jgi:predicted RNA-binding protein YlxR (DUF448 family)
VGLPVKQKKLPQRTCVGCRAIKLKRKLIRIVRTPEGTIIVDQTGKANGRGAYVCVKTECLEAAFRSKRLSKALDVEIDKDEIVRIKDELDRIIKASTSTKRDAIK